MGYNELVATQCEGLFVAARLFSMAPRSTNQVQQNSCHAERAVAKMHGGCFYKHRLGSFVLFSRIQTPFV